LSTSLCLLCLGAAAPALAQEPPVGQPIDVDGDGVTDGIDVNGDGVLDAADGGPTGVPGPGAPGTAPPGSLEARVAALEEELAREREDDDDDEDWVIRLRGGYFKLDHRPERRLLPIDRDDNEGWAVGIDLLAPIWDGDDDRPATERNDDGTIVRYEDRDDDGDRDDDDLPLDAYMRLSLDYRHLGDDETTGISGGEGAANYLDILFGPMIRFPIADDDGAELVIPYVFTGLDIVIADPDSEDGSGLDLGYVLGAGLELRVHPRIGVGVEYRHTWFGVADLEDEDYSQIDGFISFYF
jgi:hypothetical protein